MTQRSKFRLQVEKVLDAIGITEDERGHTSVFTHHNKRSTRVKYSSYMVDDKDKIKIIELLQSVFPDQTIDVFNSPKAQYNSDYFRGMTIRVFKTGIKGFKQNTTPFARKKRRPPPFHERVQKILRAEAKVCECCKRPL